MILVNANTVGPRYSTFGIYWNLKYLGFTQGRIKLPRGPGLGPGAGPPHPTPLVSARLVVIATLLAHFH